MKCNCKFEKEFSDALGLFLEQWREREDTDAESIIDNLMLELKIEAACTYSDYFGGLGILTDKLICNLDQMFYDMNPNKEEE